MTYTENSGAVITPRATAPWTVETATETRTFTDEQDAKDWQATQPAGSSRY